MNGPPFDAERWAQDLLFAARSPGDYRPIVAAFLEKTFNAGVEHARTQHHQPLLDLLTAIEQQGALVVLQNTYLVGRVLRMGTQQERISSDVTRIAGDISKISDAVTVIKGKLDTVSQNTIDEGVQRALQPLADDLDNVTNALDASVDAVSALGGDTTSATTPATTTTADGGSSSADSPPATQPPAAQPPAAG
jgi:hypothetical protein